MVTMVEIALSANGVDTAEAVARGALILSSDRSHLRGGVFDPDAMIEQLCFLIDVAVADGYQGLCATGDMRWELGEDENFERLVEYEARLEQVFRDKPLRGICQYHRDLVPARAVRDALVTHRSAYIGHALNRDNLFYIPPELLLDGRDGAGRARQGEWMYHQIGRVLDAEQTRDKALEALRDSEAHQRRLAGELAVANRELERRVAERTAELEVAVQQLEAFSYSVSHDLRAPLRTVSAFSDILADEVGNQLDSEARGHLERVRAGARHMGELIDAMLALSKVAKAPVSREPVDLSALADQVSRELSGTEAGRRAEFVIHRDLHTIGDPALLRAVITNLLGNAWKFTRNRPAARIEFGKQGDQDGYAVFFVRDNGAGFDMRYANKLFGVFQRLHRQEEFPGTGIGLATVHRVVAQHGGRVWAEGRPGEGATFFLSLPRV
jgi:signal transduction histidine kinase